MLFPFPVDRSPGSDVIALSLLGRADRLTRSLDRGALYEKALLPFVLNVVVDGRLVTGQNPGSAKATAQKVAAQL